MKKSISFFILISSYQLAIAQSFTPYGLDEYDWNLTFDEEFDGGSLDQTYWNNHIWYEDPHPLINYIVEDGVLKIFPEQGFVNRTLDTDGKFSQKYGFFEARLKLNRGLGVWPAFWLLSHEDDQRPEIDIMEAYPGGGPDSGWGDDNLNPINYGFTLHKANEDYSYHEVPYSKQMTDYLPQLDLSVEYHVYGVKWLANTIQFYFDGQQIGETYTYDDQYFDKQMYILLDLWFGSASGTPDENITPMGINNSYEIDYVRVWQKEEYNLVLSTAECEDYSSHNLIVEVTSENSSSGYFDVWINDVLSGNFEISEFPVTFLVENSELEFDHVMVCKTGSLDACKVENIANPCYLGGNCQIYNVTADIINCENGFFNVLFNFQHEFNRDSFVIQCNGMVYGHYAYTDLPVLIQGLPADCETDYKFLITDIGNSDCQSDSELGFVCCSEDCNISNLHIISSDCKGDNTHSLTIDFDVKNSDAQTYNLWVGSHFFGELRVVDLPQYVQLVSTVNEFNKIKIKLNDLDSCFSVVNIKNPCYLPIGICDSTKLHLSISNCDQKNYHTLTIDFDVEKPGNAIYDLWINSVYYWEGMVAWLPKSFTIGNTINQYNNVVLRIRDLDSCMISRKILNPCFIPPGDCNIYNVTAEITSCGYELIDVLIDCQYENVSDSFRIEGNNRIFGTYAYTDLPMQFKDLLKIGENYQFNIVDVEKHCYSSVDLGIQANICHNNSIIPYCEDGKIWSGWTFFEGAFEIDSIDIIVNGNTIKKIEYKPDSLYYFGFDNPGTENIEMKFGTSIHGYGINSIELKNPCYNPSDDCIIHNVVGEVTNCYNGLFNILINCQHEFTSDSFRIQGNGHFYGNFAYSNLPVLIQGLAADCETEYEFNLIDMEKNDCQSSLNYGKVCCCEDCKITNFQLSTSDCVNNNHHELTLDFDIMNPGNDYYEVWLNGTLLGKFLISELPKTLEVQNSTLEYDHVLICINDAPNFCIEGQIINPCFLVSNCNIDDVVAEVINCNNGLFNILINCQHEFTSDSLRLEGNGNNYGFFSFNQLPVLLEGLNADCQTNYEFVITDIEIETCQKSKQIGKVCCDPNSTIHADFMQNEIYYLFESKNLLLNLYENQYDIIIISIYNVMGQKINEMQLVNASGEYQIEVPNNDHIQLVKVDMFKNMCLVNTKKIKIVKP